MCSSHATRKSDVTTYLYGVSDYFTMKSKIWLQVRKVRLWYKVEMALWVNLWAKTTFSFVYNSYTTGSCSLISPFHTHKLFDEHYSTFLLACAINATELPTPLWRQLSIYSPHCRESACAQKLGTSDFPKIILRVCSKTWIRLGYFQLLVLCHFFYTLLPWWKGKSP